MNRILTVIGLVLIMGVGVGWGIIPHEIDFQGRLQVAGSPPPAGSHTLSVFMVNSSGTIIWPSVPPMDLAVTTDDRGIFSLKISLPDNLPFDEPYSLKIAQIDGTRIPATDLIQSFSAVPYAFNSKNVIDTSGTGNGKIDLITSQSVAIKGKSTVANSTGVKGEGLLYGVEGYSKDGTAISGISDNEYGVIGSGGGVIGVPRENRGVGVMGDSRFSGAIGVYGKNRMVSGGGEGIGVKGESMFLSTEGILGTQEMLKWVI